MDGNHSLLVVTSHLIHCADAQAPLTINIILGLPANMCVMWLILAGPRDKAAEIFSLNQAVCEVAICITSAIFLIAGNTAISKGADFTYLLCTLRFFLGFIFAGRPLFMSCVCLERYLAVVHPVTSLKYKLLRYRLAGAVISWLTVLVCCIILVWVPYTAIHYVTFGMAFTWFLVQLFCCVEILRALVRPGPGEGNQESSGTLKAFRIIMIIFVSLGLSYLPYIMSISLLGHISEDDSSKMYCFATCVVIVSGFVPPLLYLHRAGKPPHCFKIKNISNMTPNS